ncbi:MAG: hypothetical protein U0361_11790 [Nitrospiraceae bacterium]
MITLKDGRVESDHQSGSIIRAGSVSMPFWFAMAWRESRAAWRHFVLVSRLHRLGVGAVAGVALFSADVERAVLKEARGLLGGDLEIRLSRRLSDNGSSVLRAVTERGALLTHVSELVAMVTKHSRR